jgi:hypothetical protein
VRDDKDNAFYELADPDAETKAAERTCRDIRVKRFDDWMKIAHARAEIEEKALHIADIDPEEIPGYKRNPTFQAAIRKIKEYYPCLLEYGTATRNHLSWLNDHADELYQWHEKLPAHIQVKLTNPSMIRKRYEADKSATGA